MFYQVELWKALVGMVLMALPLTFAIYWIKNSILRIPADWKEFWGKFSHRTATN